MDLNVVVNLFCILILIILHIWVSMDMMIERERKIQMNICIALVEISILAEIGCIIFDNTRPELRGLSIVMNMIGFMITPYIFILESHFYNTVYHKKAHFLCYIPATINAFCVLISPLNGWIFYVTKDNQYHRGEFYYIYIVAFVFSILYSLYKKSGSVKYLPHYFFYRSLISSLLLYPGFLIQLMFPEYRITLLIMTIHLLLCLSFTSEMGGLMDDLTGLLNRNAFNKYIELLSRVKKKRHTVIVYDLDKFKELNDDLGHAKGDEYLRLVSRLLTEVYKSRIYRYGGDEFVVFMKTKDQQMVKKNVDLFEEKIDALRKADPHIPTVSYGYALYDGEKPIKEVVKMADLLMYQYKHRS